MKLIVQVFQGIIYIKSNLKLDNFLFYEVSSIFFIYYNIKNQKFIKFNFSKKSK